MFSTKKDIDRHVKTSLNKLPENERYMRGLAIARQYFKLNEYASAEHWLSCFLSVQEDSAQAHRLLGLCYEKQRKYDRAITAYQRSLQLDSKQTGLISDVCNMLLMDDNLSKNLSKAKHWCDLAESERINHEAVLNLKLKIANRDATTDKKLVKDIILKEIIARPLEPALRVRLVDYFLEEKKLDEAFRYCFELELKFSEAFLLSSEWTNGVANMLTKYTERNWNYYLLLAIVLDRQIYLNLLADSAMEAIKRSNIKEVAHKLYELDQTLRQVAEKGRNAAPQKQMAEEYLRHYRGQLLLHSAALLFKASTLEQTGAVAATSGRSRDTTRKCLALLLLAYQCGTPDPDVQWLKQSNDTARQVMAFWNKQAAFRCCQAGATLLSCVEESVDVSVLAQIQSVTETKVWTTADDLINQIRQLCTDPGWRKQVFRSLYPSGDTSAKATSASYFVQDPAAALGEPQYTLPKREQLETYIELAQLLYPSSLTYLVYLGLIMGTDNLHEFRCKAFARLNFSTNNLDNCNLETLNQLDMDSFLYCAILVAQSNLDGERQHQPAAAGGGRPSLLPAANLIPLLCEDNKIEWWKTAYHLIRSSTANDAAASVADQKQLLQHGLQAIRGTGAPLCDVIVLLKLGQILAKRASSSSGGALISAEERRHVECRAETVYRAGVLLWKLRNESSSACLGSAGSTGAFFKYGIEPYDCQRELVKLAETAITFLAGSYFKHGRYEEFTQDFGGIPLPFAAYFRAEAFRKLDESNKTPLKAKKFYSERARECIRQTQRYLELPYVERNHPLNFVVQNELKRLSSLNDSLDGSLNTSANGGGLGAGGGGAADDSDHFQSFTSSMTNPPASGMLSGMGGSGGESIRHSDRDTATAAATAAATVCLSKTTELESLIRQMMETLTFVKEDVLGIRNDVGDMQDRLVKIEENIYRKPAEGGTTGRAAAEGGSAAAANAAATAAAVQAMNDMYLMDEFQNSATAAAVAYHQAVSRLPPTPQQQQQQQQQQVGITVPYHALYGGNAYASYLSPHQQAQMLTPRGHPMAGPMGASPMHHSVYHQQQQQQHADNLLIAGGGGGQSPAAGAYHHLPAYQTQVPPPPMPPSAAPTVAAALAAPSQVMAKQQQQQQQPQPGAGLSIEQSLQTPSLLSSWNSTYNNTFSNIPSSVTMMPPHLPGTTTTTTTEMKGGAPVNVVITSSDPLPPPPSANSSTFASGTGGVQPTYSVTIPPQHIKHSNTGGSIGQGTTSTMGRVETISPAASNTQFPLQTTLTMTGKPALAPPVAVPPPAAAPAASSVVPSPFFANAIASSPAKPPGANVGEDDDDDDDARNVSGSAEYDPRPDFKPIIPLPAEIVVRTGEEDEEQMFTGRSKLLRLVDREWKERGLGELKILRSKADPSKYRIVMRREQVHKICANHYITPELIIKPMEKRPECYIWAALDFADEEPRKESFCARFGTAELAKQFHGAFVAARDEVARLKGDNSSAGEAAPSAPPSTTGSFSFSSSTAKSTGNVASTAQTSTPKPFGEFTFAKNYTPPVKPPAESTPDKGKATESSKPSPFASFTFKAQPTGGTAGDQKSCFGVIFDIPRGVATNVSTALGFEEKDFKCSHEAPIVALKRKDQPQAKDWSDCSVSEGTLRLLTSKGVVRLVLRKPAPLPLVCLNHVVPKETSFSALEKTGCSWTVPQDVVYHHAGPITFAAFFKSADERDRFLAAAQKAVGVAGKAAATPATGGGGFGDLFKPKSGSWDCGQCYVNNKADAARCLACDGPRDPTKTKDEGPATKPAAATMTGGGGGGGGLFGNLVPPAEGSKFTFGMPQSTNAGPGTVATAAPSFGGSGVLTGGAKKEEPAAKAPPTAGFGDKFKPKPGVWTCNGCYLSNGADTLYCMSCEAPKDDTVPKKSAAGASEAAGSVAGLLKAADTMPKFNFTAGGGFTFGAPQPAAAAATAAAPPAASTAPSSSFGGGFTFGSPAATTTTNTTTQQSDAPAKPVFKFELPTPAGGLSFGSKLTTTATEGTTSAISKLDPPEKASFEFVFKSKSPGRTLSGGSTGAGGGGGGEGAADEDGAGAGGGGGGGGDNSVTEEENNTYFAPVIPLPEKVEVKTGEEDEHVLYAHRAKLYRFVSSEWKERGIGDVKILKHKETGKLRVVMRREQVLKICLNHGLTEDICYSKKDDKSWQFVANDFSEGAFELMNFCLRFKTADVAQEFRDAITDALSGKLTASDALVAAAPSSSAKPVGSEAHNDTTVTSTTSPDGPGANSTLNFSKLSDISLNERETAQKLKLPENFFDCPATPCRGCRGCDPDAFVFPPVDTAALVAETEADDVPLPINIQDVKPLPIAPPKKVVSFGAPAAAAAASAVGGSSTFAGAATPADTKTGMFAGFPTVPTATKSVGGGVSSATSGFLAAEQKSSSSSPFMPQAGSIFSGSQTTTGQTDNTKLIFGSVAGVGSSNAAGGGSIFSASLNTTPKTSFVSPPPPPAAAGEADKKPEPASTPKPALLQQATLTTTTTPSPAATAKPLQGGNLFGSAATFGSAGGGGIFGTVATGTTTPGGIFGGSANLFSSASSNNSGTPTSTAGLFGSVTGFGGDSAATKPASVFGGGGFTFGGLAKQQTVAAGKPSLTSGTSADAAPLLTMDDNVSFAALASSNQKSGFAIKEEGGSGVLGGGSPAAAAAGVGGKTLGSGGGFVGLTVKEDFFSRSAAAKLNSSGSNNNAGGGNNGNADGEGGGGEGGGGPGEENYDPYYAPVIQLPDEIEVRTGEEEETKLFGERAKLYRYDADTKEWKERGVGELKVLHHPVRNAYRMLLRREQIHKLVLNHAVTADLSITPMNNSDKAFVWGAINHAEGPDGQLERLAVRFKNESIASQFRGVLEQCQEQMRNRPDLEPDQD